jgi:ribosomal protein L20
MWARWQGDIRLLNQQNHAINRLANQPEVELADEDLDQFAYENALPVAFVRSELPRRRDAIAKRQARAAQQKLEAEEAFRKRHAAAQQTLRAKMQQRRDEIRRTWEARIQSIARDAGVEFSEQLVGFMNRRVVAMSKANITDKTIYEIVRLSIKQMGTEEDVQEQQDEMPMPMPLPLPMGKRKMKAPLTPAQRLSRSNPGGFAGTSIHPYRGIMLINRACRAR